MSQRCFIQIKNGNPVNHPIVEANFRMAFPKINIDNLPPEFAEFIRVPKPNPDEGKYITSSSVNVSESSPYKYGTSFALLPPVSGSI